MEAQRLYVEEQKYIEGNRETLDKLVEQEQQAMMSQGPASLFEMLVPKPPPTSSENPEAKLDAESQDPAKKA